MLAAGPEAGGTVCRFGKGARVGSAAEGPAELEAQPALESHVPDSHQDRAPEDRAPESYHPGFQDRAPDDRAPESTARGGGGALAFEEQPTIG